MNQYDCITINKTMPDQGLLTYVTTSSYQGLVMIMMLVILVGSILSPWVLRIIFSRKILRLVQGLSSANWLNNDKAVQSEY